MTDPTVPRTDGGGTTMRDRATLHTVTDNADEPVRPRRLPLPTRWHTDHAATTDVDRLRAAIVAGR